MNESISSVFKNAQNILDALPRPPSEYRPESCERCLAALLETARDLKEKLGRLDDWYED